MLMTRLSYELVTVPAASSANVKLNRDSMYNLKSIQSNCIDGVESVLMAVTVSLILCCMPLIRRVMQYHCSFAKLVFEIQARFGIN
jgi:uncharacterized protein YqhQ